jgi:hypothetical protein
MPIRIRLPLLMLIAVAVGFGSLAPAAGALSGCGGNQPSAITQYCESIPNANGSSPVPPSTHHGSTAAQQSLTAAPLLYTLPRSSAVSILRSRKHSRLLTIPGPYRHTSASGAAPPVSGFDLIRTLVLIILAAAISLATLAGWRHRRRASHA